MSVISIQLQSEFEEPLEFLANELRQSKNWIINEAIREYLARKKEDAIRWKETLEALDSVKAGRVVESEKVHAWLESWGKDNELSPPSI